jgi:MGT family glycosyltransferase
MQSKDLNLIVDIPTYTPQDNLPPNFHFVGPIVWEPNLPVPDWLESLDKNRPVIYFTMGSTGFEKFFEVAVDLFADTKYQVIFTIGGMTLPAARPANFFIEHYAPGLKLMKVSSLVVCHGGNGTIYQALSQGVPIIGIPTMHDQWFNMERVEDLGAGIKLDEKKFKPEHLANAVEKIFSDQTLHKNIEPLKEEMAQYDAPRQAAELIIDYLHRK